MWDSPQCRMLGLPTKNLLLLFQYFMRIAHSYIIYKPLMKLRPERLGEEVGDIVGARKMVDLNFIFLYIVADCMILDVDMLSFAMV